MITGILIGAGQRGMDVYAEYAVSYPLQFKIVAVAEPNSERRKEMQQRHNIADNMAFTSWEEILKCEKMADCALVCTQDRMHTQPVIAALEKGYHVMCEKPMSPSAAECVQMGTAAKMHNKTITVCHVLRYSPFYTKLKALLQSGVIGELVSVQHIESVAFWHQAHSFVRGNWRNSNEACPMILAKSCHDMDILSYLVNSPCTSVSSFGSLKHFKPENAPSGSTQRCFDGCKVTHECPYFCGKIYLQDSEWYSSVIRKVVALENTQEAVTNALKTGPYGRCVYHCDNNVVDHQVVNLLFENDVTVSFTMCAFTAGGGRTVNFMGTHGQIKGDMEQNTIEITDFLTGNTDTINIKVGASGHSGSDEAFMRGFIRTVETNGEYSLSSADMSIDSHLIALAAEQSRISGKTVSLQEFKAAALK